jgi:hypothetical protein
MREYPGNPMMISLRNLEMRASECAILARPLLGAPYADGEE